MTLTWARVRKGLRRRARSAGTKVKGWLGLKTDADMVQLRMVRTFVVGEPRAPWDLPGSFRLQGRFPGMEQAWVDLLNRSREFGQWSLERLEEEMLDHLLPEGAIFVASGPELIACAAVCHFPADAPLATLMYVVVLPEYRGHGLGKGVTTAAIHAAAAAGFPGIALRTDDYRVHAIKTYLELGFTPDIRPGTQHQVRWDKVTVSVKELHESKQMPCSAGRLGQQQSR
jgi:mycothiol synthase